MKGIAVLEVMGGSMVQAQRGETSNPKTTAYVMGKRPRKKAGLMRGAS